MLLWTALVVSCGDPAATATGTSTTPAKTVAQAPPTTATTATASPPPTSTTVPTLIPTVQSLQARVTVAGFLSCRYGPGPSYLFLDALRTGTNLTLIGRADGANWEWVWVGGTQNNCWVHAGLLELEGDRLRLPIVYPGQATLPISPYYPPTVVLAASRGGSLVTVRWLDVPLRAGDQEDERMQHYIIEAWRCEGGELLFEPLATNDTSIAFVDEPGCMAASHGRVFVQEKHGFAGPAEIPWPE